MDFLLLVDYILLFGEQKQEFKTMHTPQFIKDWRKKLIIQREEINKELVHLETICPHTEIVEGLYSYRIGVSSPAYFCDSCGKLIKYK